MAETEPRDVAGALIESLADGGELVDDGGFTLDPATALAKLRAFQLDDPHAYVLLLIEAAWLAGYRKHGGGVRVTLGSTTTIELGGVALDHLPELFTAALVGGRGSGDGERVLQLLGLAANAALALEPEQIRITATDASKRATVVRIDDAGGLTVGEAEGEGAGDLRPSAVRFELHGAGLGLSRNQAEEALLRERCRHTSLPILLGEEPLARGPTADLREAGSARDVGRVRAEIRVEGRPIGVAGHTLDPAAPARLLIVNRGVTLAEPLDLGPGVQAIVEVDLPVDLSRKQLVAGAELEAIRAGARAALAQLGPTATPPAPKPPAVQSWLIATLAVAIVMVIMQVCASVIGPGTAPP